MKPIILPKTTLLFLLKQRNTVWNSGDQYASELSSGLLNSVRFVTRMIEKNFGDQYASELSSGLLNSIRFVTRMIKKSFGFCQPYLEQVADGNGIDRVVTQIRPQVVIIEALWVTPEKLSELCRLHPDVKWVIRLHSEVPFLANEGIAMDWLNRYVQVSGKVLIAANSHRAARELSELLHHNVLYLPNYYEIENS